MAVSSHSQIHQYSGPHADLQGPDSAQPHDLDALPTASQGKTSAHVRDSLTCPMSS